jgi:tetratricopeptide (TPR) repeat protein
MDNPSMKFRSFIVFGFLNIFLVAILACSSASAQDPAASKPINLDRDLEEPVANDLASSYYHYSLSQWFENNGDLSKALSEMRLASKYNPNSPAIHVETAILLGKTGNITAAIDSAQAAVRLDPKDPDPHWLLANIFFKMRENKSSSKEWMMRAVQELETLKEITPKDERIYYSLGTAYFELNETDKAIQAFERYQSLPGAGDNGYRELATYYENAGNLEKAIEFLNKGLTIQPDSPESLMQLGGIYTKLGRKNEAVPLFKKLLGSPDISPIAVQKLAATLFDAGEYQETINALKGLEIKVRPERDSQVLLGRAQLELRNYSEAIQTLQIALKYFPDDLEISFYLGRALEENGKYADAAKIFSNLLNATTDSSRESSTNRLLFQQHLAAVYLELRDYEKSIALYQEMVKTDPRANAQLLNAYRVSRQFDKAILFGKELYEKDLKDIPIGVLYARTLADAGKSPEGADILSGLLQSNPENIDLYVNLSQVYLQGKRYADAEAILLRAENKNLSAETNERLKFQRAAVYERQKEFDRAESLFKEILKSNPSNAIALNYMGYMLADRGVRLEEAVQYVKKALSLDPNNGAYLDSLGWAFFKLNDLEKAERYLLEAANLVSNDPTIEEHLGDLYHKTGNLEKAKDFWTRSISIGTEPEDIQKVRRKLEVLQEKLRKQKPTK